MAPKKKSTSKPKSQISRLDKGGSEISTNSPALYTLDDIVHAWITGVNAGATILTYCQDNGKDMKDFEKGVAGLLREIQKDKTDKSIRMLMSSQMVLLMAFEGELAGDNVSPSK